MHARPRHDPPDPGRESAWDYPRPPIVVPSDRLVRIEHGGQLIAETRRALRVLETAGAPVWYLPAADVRAAWAYDRPLPGFERLAGHVAFYAGRVDHASVDGETVRPQPGGFHGGWVTNEVVGPFKGEPGTEGW